MDTTAPTTTDLADIIGPTLAALVRDQSSMPNLRGQILRRTGIFVPDDVPAADLEGAIIAAHAEEQALLQADPLHGLTFAAHYPPGDDASRLIIDAHAARRPPVSMTLAQYRALAPSARAKFGGVLAVRSNYDWARVIITDRPDITPPPTPPPAPPAPALTIDVTADRTTYGTASWRRSCTESGAMDYSHSELLDIAEQHEWDLDDIADHLRADAVEHAELDSDDDGEYEYDEHEETGSDTGDVSASLPMATLREWLNDNRPPDEDEGEEEDN